MIKNCLSTLSIHWNLARSWITDGLSELLARNRRMSSMELSCAAKVKPSRMANPWCPIVLQKVYESNPARSIETLSLPTVVRSCREASQSPPCAIVHLQMVFLFSHNQQLIPPATHTCVDVPSMPSPLRRRDSRIEILFLIKSQGLHHA